MSPERCPLPWQQMVVGNSGNVVPCCYRSWKTHFGDVRKEDCEAIWNGAAYRQLREEMTRVGHLQACPDCQIRGPQGIPKFQAKPQFFDSNPAYAENMKTVQGEFDSGASRMKGKCTMLTIAPSGKCNLSCVQCAQRENFVYREKIGPNAWLLIESLIPHLDYLNWSGGEPLIMPELEKFLASELLSQCPQLTFAGMTNGQLFDVELVRKIKHLAQINVGVSIDAGTQETYERIRRGGSWSKLMGNLQDLASRRSEFPNLWFAGSYTINKMNVLDICKYIDLCKELRMPTCFYYVWHYPTDLRPDTFCDVDAETVGWEEELNRANAAARAFDEMQFEECRHDGQLYKMYPFLDRYATIIQQAIAKARDYRRVRIWLGPEHAGKFVLAVRSGTTDAVSYGYCGKKGFTEMRLPDADVDYRVYEDRYLHRPVKGLPCPHYRAGVKANALGRMVGTVRKVLRR